MGSDMSFDIFIFRGVAVDKFMIIPSSGTAYRYHVYEDTL